MRSIGRRSAARDTEDRRGHQCQHLGQRRSTRAARAAGRGRDIECGLPWRHRYRDNTPSRTSASTASGCWRKQRGRAAERNADRRNLLGGQALPHEGDRSGGVASFAMTKRDPRSGALAMRLKVEEQDGVSGIAQQACARQHGQGDCRARRAAGRRRPRPDGPVMNQPRIVAPEVEMKSRRASAPRSSGGAPIVGRAPATLSARPTASPPMQSPMAATSARISEELCEALHGTEPGCGRHSPR